MKKGFPPSPAPPSSFRKLSGKRNVPRPDEETAPLIFPVPGPKPEGPGLRPGCPPKNAPSAPKTSGKRLPDSPTGPKVPQTGVTAPLFRSAGSASAGLFFFGKKDADTPGDSAPAAKAALSAKKAKRCGSSRTVLCKTLTLFPSHGMVQPVSERQFSVVPQTHRAGYGLG